MEKQTKLLERLLAKFDTEVFQKPTLEEITEYLGAKESQIDPLAFYEYYESVGWKVGKKPMRSWQSAIATWEKKDKSSKTLEL